MNAEETQEQGPTAPTAGPAAPAPGAAARSGVGLAVLALLLALTATAGGLYLWQSLQRQVQATAGSLAQLRAGLDGVAPRLDRLETEIGATEHTLRQRLDTEVAQLRGAQEALQRVVTEQRGMGWEPAEIEYLLRIANDSLTIKGEVATAIAALTAADRRLSALADPGFAETRRLIAAELVALRAVALPDIAGMMFELEGLQQGIDQLVLKGPAPQASGAGDVTPVVAEEGETPRWRRFLQGVWQQLRQLVTIRRHAEGELALLRPDEQAFLRQNLYLKLEMARLALYQEDQAGFATHLDVARQWLERFFDRDHPTVAAMGAALEGLRGVQVAVRLPDISASLVSLRAVLKQRMEGTAVPAGGDRPADGAPDGDR